MDEVNKAAEVAAARTGLTPEQVRSAVDEYRAASRALEVEPQWTMLMHMSGREDAMAQYGAEGTAVTFQVESHKDRGEWKEYRYYVFADKPFETFHEAKLAELSSAKRREIFKADNVVPLPNPPSKEG